MDAVADQLAAVSAKIYVVLNNDSFFDPEQSLIRSVRRLWKQYRYRTLPLQNYWSYHYKSNVADLKAAVANDYPATAPEHSLHHVAQQQFSRAVEIILGHGSPELAENYFDRGLVAVDRLLSNDAVTNAPGCSLRFPLNRAMATRVLVYTHAIRGQALDKRLLSAASVDFEEVARRYDDVEDPQDNNEQTRYYWVDSIHTALISDDVSRARVLLDSIPKPIKYHARRFELLRQAVARSSNELSAKELRDFATRFCQFFEHARDPRNWGTPDYYTWSIISAVELGMLRYSTIDHAGKHVDMSQVVNTLNQ